MIHALTTGDRPPNHFAQPQTALDIPPSFIQTKGEAKAARERARTRLAIERGVESMTLAAFAERWTSDPLFSRPKESTNIFNRERIKHFVERYGALPIAAIGDRVVSEWLAGGHNVGTVPSLRARCSTTRHPRRAAD
jgi:hypothetical protein